MKKQGLLGLLAFPMMLAIATPPASAGDGIYTYRCDGDRSFVADISQSVTHIRLEDGTILRLQRTDDSDTKLSYSDGETTFISQGSAASMEAGGVPTYIGCVIVSSEDSDSHIVSSGSTVSSSASTTTTSSYTTQPDIPRYDRPPSAPRAEAAPMAAPEPAPAPAPVSEPVQGLW